MRRAISVLNVCLVFASGILTGLLVAHLLEKRPARVWNFADQPSKHVIEMVRDDLSLTEEQTAKVEKILDDASHQFNDLHAQAQDVRAQAKQKIREVLNDTQKQKFEASMNRLQKVIAAGQ